MCKAGLTQKLTTPLRAPQVKDFYFAFGVAVLSLVLHTSTLIVEISAASEVEILTQRTVPPLFLIIELCLFVCVAGLWMRKTWGLLISMAALLSTVTGYVIWYLASRQFLQTVSSLPFQQLPAEAIPPHPLGLLGATWMSVVVLTLSGVLLIWEAKTLLSLSKTLDKADANS